MEEVWSERRGWAELRREGELALSADEAARARIARFLDIEDLRAFRVTLTHGPWLDGVEIAGRLEATAGRLCGVSLEPFDERVDASVRLRLVPEGSPNAPAPETELVVSLEAEDPPEVVRGDGVDLGDYVIEALGLALDPFPRKPDAVFDYVDPAGEVSPFAVLKFIKPMDPT
jgi:hypothetical protein